MKKTIVVAMMALLLMIVVDAGFSLFGFYPITVDIVLIFVLYLGFVDWRHALSDMGVTAATLHYDRQALAKAATILLVGYASDLVRGSPQGTYTLTLAVAYLGARVLGRRLHASTRGGQILTTIVASLALFCVEFLVRLASDMPIGGDIAQVLIARALITGLCAPGVIELFRSSETWLGQRRPVWR